MGFLRAEILDPLDNDDRLDPANQPSYVPAGFSTSNSLDGFSFAQDSAIGRSAVFAGGSATVVADEMSNRGDILMFTGLGQGTARVTFGLRDRLGLRRIPGSFQREQPRGQPRCRNRRRCCSSAPGWQVWLLRGDAARPDEGT